MTERAYIDLAEFVDCGYLQELNRQFLHPLGLALAVFKTSDGQVVLDGVLDARDDPEGFVFDDDAAQRGTRLAKAEAIDQAWTAREAARIAAIGEMVQSL